MQFYCVKLAKLFLFSGKHFIVVLMLNVFAGAPVLEMLHTHHDEVVSLSNENESVASNHPKCQVCHHFAHHQPIPLICIASLLLLHFQGKAEILKAGFIDMLVFLPGVNWTNKGPPILF